MIISLWRVLNIIIATISDKKRIITKEFIILKFLKKKKEGEVKSQIPYLNSKKKKKNFY